MPTAKKKSTAKPRFEERTEKPPDHPEPASEPTYSPPPPIEEGTSLSELPINSLFEFDGFVFTLTAVVGEEATITQVEWSPDGKYRIPRWKRSVRGDTKVKPIS